MAELSLKPISTDSSGIARNAELLRAVFPSAHQYTGDYLRWQYAENPDGPVVGYDAYDNDVLAAHYATQPLTAQLFGRSVRGLLSFNTATHPDYQGRGLFTRLAGETFRRAKDEGYEFVVGVANANSTPGFTRKLGFQLVTPLKAVVGFGQVEYRRTAQGEPQFARTWTRETAAWRLSNPAQRYRSTKSALLAPTDKAGIAALLSIRPEFSAAPAAGFAFAAAHPVRAWLGLHPSEAWRGMSFHIPQRMRPSPLNFIFLDLTGQRRTLDAGSVFFEAIDFDAY